VGRIAILIAVSYAVLGGVAVLALAAAVWSSTLGRRRQIDAHKLAERERTWFGIVVVLLVSLLFATIFFTPYGRSSDSVRQEVHVVAEQFAFLVPSTPIRAGVPVKFHLTSKDVNHGFAVYNAKDEFLFQVQVMPGRTQDYVYTFKKPGAYHIECFEYCGVGHDEMTGTFRVALKVQR
jgi:cytochrome c oxidase subunit 2